MEINLEYSLEGLKLKLKLQSFGHLMRRTDSLEKTVMLGKIKGRRRRGQHRMRWLTIEYEMVGWHHWLNGYEFEQTPGDSEAQGSLAYCSLWGHKGHDLVTEQQQNQNINFFFQINITESWQHTIHSVQELITSENSLLPDYTTRNDMGDSRLRKLGLQKRRVREMETVVS